MKKWGFALSASFAANHRQVLEISQELEILLTKDKISLQKNFLCNIFCQYRNILNKWPFKECYRSKNWTQRGSLLYRAWGAPLVFHFMIIGEKLVRIFKRPNGCIRLWKYPIKFLYFDWVPIVGSSDIRWMTSWRW